MRGWKSVAAVVVVFLYVGTVHAAEYEGTFVKAEDKKLHFKVNNQTKIIPYDQDTAFVSEAGVDLPLGVKNLVNFQILKVTTKVKPNAEKQMVETAVLVKVKNRPGD
jgi:hypothetical protein